MKSKLTKKGYNTKYDILATAKELFYQKGYNAITTLEICGKTGVKNGTFTYYYNKKQDLANEIFSEHIVKCYRIAQETLLPCLPDATDLQITVLSVLIAICAQFKDENSSRFVYETLSYNFVPDFFGKSVKRQYERLNKQMRVNMSDKELKLALSANVGALNEILFHFIEDADYAPAFDETVEVIEGLTMITCRIFKMDEGVVARAFEIAKAALIKVDFTAIDLLK